MKTSQKLLTKLKWLIPFAVLCVNSVHATFPDGVESLSRATLRDAASYYFPENNCARLLVPSPEVDTELSELAGAIRAEPLAEVSLDMLDWIRRNSRDRPPREIFSDVFDDFGNDRAKESILRPLKYSSPLSAGGRLTQWFRDLFYLLRIDETHHFIPKFLFNGHFRSIYFSGRIFWGAQVTHEELFQFHKPLFASPTLEHLTIEVPLDLLGSVLASPIIRKLSSLTLQIGEPLRRTQTFHPVRIDVLRQFAELRRFSVNNQAGDHDFPSSRLREFLTAPRLEHLELSRITIDDAEELLALKTLHSLEITNGFPVARPGEPPARVLPFFRGINPALQSLSIHGSDRDNLDLVLASAVETGPRYTGLKHLSLNLHGMNTPTLVRLAAQTHLWENLESVEVRSYGPAGNTEEKIRRKEILNRATSLSSRLGHKTLSLEGLDWASFDPPLRSLEVSPRRFQ